MDTVNSSARNYGFYNNGINRRICYHVLTIGKGRIGAGLEIGIVSAPAHLDPECYLIEECGMPEKYRGYFKYEEIRNEEKIRECAGVDPVW